MVSKAVAIDAMSGDFGPRVIVPSALQYLQENSNASVILVGQQQKITPLISSSLAHRVEVVHADDVVAMDEKPAVALRSKRQSSMRVAINLVKNGDAGACVSAGNTGALLAIGKYVLKTIPGVTRPAICGAVPSLNSHSYLLDMGANVDCDAEHLLQFALMARILLKAVDNNSQPTVALLNNGVEDIKGNNQVKQADELLSANGEINYIGYVEGHKIYDAAADIVVCDGFVGNIALKASEGVATYIMATMKRELNSDFLSRLFSLLALPALRRVKSEIDPRRFNGACLLGLNGVVVKSHGHADEKAFKHALYQTNKMLSVDIVQQLNSQFSIPVN